MFRFRLFPLGALLGLLFVFNACERHHPGELPDVQREHLHPLDSAKDEPRAAEAAGAPTVSPTPANFFPNEKP
jgi:hypothetical protein